MSEKEQLLDFSNTEIAFEDKSDKELKSIARLFGFMKNPALVDFGSNASLIAMKLHFPFVKSIIRATIFNQFCGGENLLGCQQSIDRLYKWGCLTVLDYGAESKTEEDDLDKTMEETLRAIEFAASNDSVPVVSSKITGLADNDLLIKLQNKSPLSANEKHSLDKLNSRPGKFS